jgi:AcrR family transcriptional regulator
LAKAGSTLSQQRDRKRASNRKRILTAAAELFYERGYAGTTLDAICDRVGATKPFVYWYFKDKAEIFDMVSLDAARVTLSSLKSEAAADVETRLRVGLHALINNNVRLFKSGSLFYREPQSLSDHARNQIRSMASQFNHELTDLIQEGIDQGILVAQDAKLTTFAIAGIVGFMYTWYRPNGPLPPDEIAKRLTTVMLRAAGLDVRDSVPAPRRRHSDKFATPGGAVNRLTSSLDTAGQKARSRPSAKVLRSGSR